MFHMFQLEALNNWEHISQDLYSRDLKVMEQKKGKQAAAGAFAAILVKMVLGAFLLNRVDEELYGGTPAAFDILGTGRKLRGRRRRADDHTAPADPAGRRLGSA